MRARPSPNLTQRMPEVLRFPVSLLLLLTIATLTAQAADYEMQFTPAAAVYKLQVKRAGQIADGSAVLIAPGRLLTACHVTRAAESIKIGRDELTWRAYPAGTDIDHDLCVLSAPELSLAKPAVVGATQGLRPGEPVIAIGYPRGGKIELTYGEIKGVHAYDGANILQVSAAFDHGQSGGGVFDAAGRLIGIIGFKTVAGGDFNYALPLAWAGDAVPGQPALANAPLHGGRPFWQRTDEAQRPLFLRAASLEANRKWEALRGVAQEWIATDATNPASWRCLARALTNLGHNEPAAFAFAQAESLQPSLAGTDTSTPPAKLADAQPTPVDSGARARR